MRPVILRELVRVFLRIMAVFINRAACVSFPAVKTFQAQSSKAAIHLPHSSYVQQQMTYIFYGRASALWR